MKKKLLLIICISIATLLQALAQTRTITGTVTSKGDGLPIPGATVKIKGTSTGTQTNTDGKYSLSVPAGATLVVSFVGFTSQQIVVGGQSTLNIAMVESASQLGEVVITTSLGIRHSEKELGYSAAKVTAKELTNTNVTNVANGLTAKVAGLAIYTLDNGIDPNVSIVLRGNRSLEGNNNALIVLDGVPIPGATISSINPNDIADITILKGAGSAALYGSEASNGAILLTTKRGTGDGKPTITYGNSFQFEKVGFFPKLQTTFGTYGGETAPLPDGTNTLDPITGAPAYIPYENQQYGPRYDGSTVVLGAPLDSANGRVVKVPYSPYPVSPIKAFFNTGYTEQNDISFSQGDTKNSFFMSAQNVIKTGVTPNDKNIKDAFSVRGHRTYGIFSLDYSVGYTKTKISTYINNITNPFAIPGSFVVNAGANDLYSSILQFPAFYNLKSYQDPNSELGNVNNFPDAYAINPYWIVNNSRWNINRDVLLSTVNLKLSPTSWLDASYRLSNNFGIDQERYTKQEVDFTPYAISDYYHAGNTASGFTTGKSLGYVADYYQFGDGTNALPNGVNTPGGNARIQGDAILDFHHTFLKDFKTNLIVGNSIWQEHAKSQFSSSNALLLKDFYNINTVGGTVSAFEGESFIRQIAYFGEASVSYKGYLTLDGTFRNEQDSRLSKAERSFNYPSIKLAFIPTDAIPALKDNKILNYAKIYSSLSRVGNIDIGPYEIHNNFGLPGGFPFGSLGGLNAGGVNYSPTLKPELTTEFEIGTELAFFNSRLDINLTYYNQHVKNQTAAIGTSITTGYNTSILNIGETQSSGKEVQITGDILTQAQNKVGFRLGANFSINDSKVISLLPGSTRPLFLGNGQYAEIGKPFPLLEGTDFIRDPQGHVVVSATTGYPTTNAGVLTQFGRTTPKYNLGITSSISYKFVSLSGVAEYRGGDVVFNGLGGALTFAGAGANTASAGRQSFVYPNSVIQTSPGVYVPNTNVNVQNGNYGFWQGSAYPGTASPFVSSGAFWKLRELNLSFNLNQFVKQSRYVKGVTLALTGRNLFLWVPKNNPWTDPEFSNAPATSNLRGLNNIGQLPETRVFGADLKVTF